MVELGAGVQATSELRLDGSLTWFDFEVEQQQVGDVLLPSTPKWKGTIGFSYVGRQGLEFGLNARFVDGYEWAAGCSPGPSRRARPSR